MIAWCFSAAKREEADKRRAEENAKREKVCLPFLSPCIDIELKYIPNRNDPNEKPHSRNPRRSADEKNTTGK